MNYYCKTPNILFSACQNNDTEIIKECIRNGYDVNQQNFWFKTPLMIASEINNLNAVKILVENGADLNIIDINGSTALGYAEDNSVVQQYLKNNGAKYLKRSTEGMSNLRMEIKNKTSVSETTKEIINKIDSWGFSPFMWAIWYESEDHFKYYLNLEADVNQKCRNGTTPLMMASCRKQLKMVKELIQKGGSVNDIDNNGNSALAYCASLHMNQLHTKLADLLICKGTDITNSGVTSPLTVAVICKDLLELEYFLNQKANVNAMDNTGNTALAYASYSGEIDSAKILIENKADLDLCGPKEKTPLSWAATTNNLEMVEFLLMNGAKVRQKDYQNNTALSYAQKYGHSKIIKYLQIIQEATLRSAIQQNNLELVKSLIEIGVEPSKVDNTGNTPLMTATRAKNPKIIKYLLENGAELTVHSALPIAIEEQDLNIIKLLVKNSASVNKYYKSVKQTPLTQAVTLNNKEIVQFLIENGANPNLTGNLLRTAIEVKCQYNIVKYLIEKGTKVIETSGNQPSLLKLAIEEKNMRLIVLLVNHGANVRSHLDELKEFSEENDDFQVFFQKKIASQFVANKHESNN